MSKINVSVAIADEHLDHISAVAEALQAHGLTILSVMEMLGVVTGVCDDSMVGTLRTVNGVDSVEVGQTFHLAPPDSSVQ